MGTILLIILILLLIGALPAWPLVPVGDIRPVEDSDRFFYRHYSRFNGTSVNKHVSGRRRFLDPSARTERRALPSPFCNR